MSNALFLIAGCHGGYNIVDEHDVPGVTLEPDWAQALARQGATVIAGTGYQYGDTDFIEYSERLYLELIRRLHWGHQPVSAGKALLKAKQIYMMRTARMRGIHVKSVIQVTLYGLPMLRIDLPYKDNRSQSDLRELEDGPQVKNTTPFAADPGAALGLEYADLSLSPVLSQNSMELNMVSSGDVTATATYFSGVDGIASNPLEPVQPLEMYDVTHPQKDMVLRGVGWRGGVYDDLPGVLPLTSAPANDLRGVHLSFNSDTFYPVQPWEVNYFDALLNDGDGVTHLALMPSQYRSDAPGAITGTLRAFSTMDLRLYYSDFTETDADSGNIPPLAAPPSISDVSAVPDGDQLAFQLRVNSDPAAGVQQVWVTYSALGGPWAGQWQALDLVQNEADPTLWQGCLALNGISAQDVRYVVQAVNGVGLVALDSNQGAYYTPEPAPGQRAMSLQETNLAWLSLPASGAFGTEATVSARLTGLGEPLANQVLVFGLGPQRIQARTDSDGVATAHLPLLGLPGAHQVSVAFQGQGYQASSALGAVSITKQATHITLDEQTATVTLADATGRPLRDKTLVFSISGSQGALERVTVTDYAGRATLGAAPLTQGDRVEVYFGSQVTLSSGQEVSLDDERYLPAAYSKVVGQQYTLYLPLVSKE
jgi:hypothetical protein